MSRTTKCFGNDFKVTDTRGRIIEENHYYAFGLKIAGISSQKFGDPNEGSLKNDYLYNDKELWDEADLNWYDYGFRNYDPQVGRFPQLDPLTDDYPYYTPYQYAGNEPIANVDLDGLEPFNSIQTLSEVVIEMPGKSALVNSFKTAAKTFSGPLALASRLIPNNSIGEKIAGGIVGAGEAINDAVVGVYNMGRHPINAVQGIAKMNTTEGQIEASIIFATNFVESQSEYGEGFTNARYISYGVTAVGLAVVGPKFMSASRGANTITTRLQAHVTRAAKEVDLLGDAAFTTKQLQAIQRNPNLRPMYRGNRIDVRARGYMKKDPTLQHLKSNYTNGPDFLDTNTGQWWDMTTPAQWQKHLNKYGVGGTLLKTQ